MPSLRITQSSPPSAPADTSSSHQLALVVVGGIVGILVMWFFGFKPALGTYRAVQAPSTAELQDRLAQRRASLEKLAAIENTFSLITDEEKKKLELALPDEPGVSDLVANMEALVRLSGLSPGSIAVETPGVAAAPAPAVADGGMKIPPGVRVVPIRLQLSGNNYLTLKKILQKIETNIRILDLPALEFSSEADGLGLLLHAFVYPPLGAKK
jgi:hypothetical protein